MKRPSLVLIVFAVMCVASSAFGQSVNINFGPDAVLDDVTYPEFTGYMGDDGSAYADRGNGYTYGWLDGNLDPTDQSETRNRNNGDSPDERWDTTNHMIKGDNHSWQIDLDNGDYNIWLVAGDANHTDQENDVSIISGDNVLDLDDDGPGNNWDEFMFAFTVMDGTLRISPNPGDNLDKNQKLSFMEISLIPEPTSLGLLAIGAVGVVGLCRRRRS